MKKVFYLCTAAILAISCGNDNDGGGKHAGNTPQPAAETVTGSRLEQVSWILGTWQNQTPEGVFTEHWEKTSEHLYTGHGSLVSPSGDTVFSEYIKLEVSNDTVYYKPVVSGQNEGKETVFTEKSISAAGMIFESPAHDFPQRIVYQKANDSSLKARVESLDGRKKEEFSFTRAGFSR
jgi:hypothetical protein